MSKDIFFVILEFIEFAIASSKERVSALVWIVVDPDERTLTHAYHP